MGSFPELVRQAREELCLTRSELGERIGISQHTVRAYENGNRRPKSWLQIQALISTLELTPEEAFALQNSLLDPIMGPERAKPLFDAETGIQTAGHRGQDMSTYQALGIVPEVKEPPRQRAASKQEQAAPAGDTAEDAAERIREFMRERGLEHLSNEQ